MHVAADLSRWDLRYRAQTTCTRKHSRSRRRAIGESCAVRRRGTKQLPTLKRVGRNECTEVVIDLALMERFYPKNNDNHDNNDNDCWLYSTTHWPT